MVAQTVTQQLEVLLNRQLIRPAGDLDYAFRHTLLREAVYTTLLRRERRVMHGAVAATLEALYANSLDEHLADLAHHYFESEDWEPAQAYATRAGLLAQRRFAPHEAHSHFTQALSAAQRRGQMPPPDLYRARGQVREVLGDFDGARDDHETALAAARATDLPRAEWQALLDLGYLWSGRDYAQTGRYFQQALTLARALRDSTMLGRSLNRVGNWHLNCEELPEALRCHEEALALFERHPDPAGLAETLDLLALTAGYQGDVAAGRRYYERALALFRQLDDRLGEASCLAVMSNLSQMYGGDTFEPAFSLAEAQRLSWQSWRLAHSIGWRAGESFALLCLGNVLLSMGDFGAAEREAQRGQRLAQEIEHRQWELLGHLMLGALYSELGQYAAAEVEARAACAAAEATHSPLWLYFSQGLLAGMLLEQGQAAAAEAALNGQPDANRPPQSAAQRSWWLAHGRLALAHRDPERALALVAQLYASLPNPTPGYAIPRLAQLQADALAKLGQWPAAEAALIAALPAAEEARTQLWRLHASLAAAYAAQGKQALAAEADATARQIVAELAATIPNANTRDQFLSLAVAYLAPPRPGVTPP